MAALETSTSIVTAGEEDAERIARFIAKQRHAATSWELRELAGTTVGALVESWTSADTDGLSALVYEAAVGDAQARGSATRYALQAVGRSAAGKPANLGRCSFVVSPEEGLSIEGSTRDSLMLMLGRNAERASNGQQAAVKQALDAARQQCADYRALCDSYQAQITSMTEELVTLRQLARENVKAREDELRTRWELETNHLRELASHKSKERVADQVEKLVNGGLEKWKADKEEGTFRALVTSMPVETVTALIGLLPGDKAEKFAEWYKKALAQKGAPAVAAQSQSETKGNEKA